jgi:prevent-host-death family protein
MSEPLEVRGDDLRRRLRPLLNSVEHDHAHVTIKRYGEDIGVIVPANWYRNMLAIKRGLLLFTRDSETCHQLPGKTEKPIGELLDAIGNAALSVLDEEPDLVDRESGR